MKRFLKINEKRQNEVYLNLTEKGIFRLMNDMKDENIGIYNY